MPPVIMPAKIKLGNSDVTKEFIQKLTLFIMIFGLILLLIAFIFSFECLCLLNDFLLKNNQKTYQYNIFLVFLFGAFYLNYVFNKNLKGS